MEFLQPPEYTPPSWLRSGHLQSIYATLCPARANPGYVRERIATPDDDFLDIDWAFCRQNNRSETLAILSHGLEGNSTRNYITGMIQALHREGVDALAWNYRGCSGTPNNQLSMYHNGSTYDLQTVVEHAINQKVYTKIILIGFSMGGNLNLLYLGKRQNSVPEEVVGGLAFSVPCDLADAAKELSRPVNQLYMQRFLKELHKKILAKKEKYPKEMDDCGYWKIVNFTQFDDRYTAPIHGFKNANDYWQQCSSLTWLDKITTPTLLVNSLDDPFLGENCYPYEIAEKSDYLQLIATRYGGHVGFVQFNKEQEYWSETLCRKFLNKIL